MEIRRIETKSAPGAGRHRSQHKRGKMKNRIAISTNVGATLCVAIGLFFWLGVSSLALQKEKRSHMTSHASGTFEVKMTPQAPDDKDAAVIGRYSFDKQFQGDLKGTSKGVMVAIGTAVPGSAGYVAMEQLTGTLNGRTGAFALQHSGTMTQGVPQLSVTVVPDSGTGELAGISGKMDIKITDGKHFYEFDYTVAPAP
jgi:hypothetical protein